MHMILLKKTAIRFLNIIFILKNIHVIRLLRRRDDDLDSETIILIEIQLAQKAAITHYYNKYFLLV